jgi:cytochrome c biogenesis protein CcmG, thiol:disulfide interchange protein DsbE
MRLNELRALTILTILLATVAVALAAATVGEPAPALAVTELNGRQFDLAAERGKVVIVNFWATWCPPCRKEMPMLNDFYRDHHNQGLEMIGVSADSSHDRSDVIKLMQSFDYPAAMMNDATANGFGSPDELPVTYVIDRSGIVRAIFTADDKPLSADQLDAGVLPLLGKASAPSPAG